MKQYFTLAVIVFAGILPFSSRAVFMDEHIFLKVAENAQHHWQFPQEVSSVFFGTPLANFAAHTHPPVGEYYLALIYRLIGHFSEVPFRLLFAVFPIAATLAFFFLARRFTEQPFLVSLLFAASPAFFVMAPTLMMDVPMLAFLLTGIALYFAHLEGRRFGLAGAAVCFVLAAGTGYTALVPLACLFVFALLAKRPAKELLAIALAPMVLALWQIVMTIHFGAFPLAKTIAYYKGHRTARNILATLSFLGGVAIYPGGVLLVNRRIRKMEAIAAFAIAALAAAGIPEVSLQTRVSYVIFATSGLLLLASFSHAVQEVIAAGKNIGEALFITWVPATLLFFIVVADQIDARYIMLALPALYLLIFRRSTAQQLRWLVIPTAVLAVSVAYADLIFVNAYRTWIEQQIVPLRQQGFTVWGAAESGPRFYLEQAGIPTLTSDDVRPKGADLVVRHDLFRYSLSYLEPMLTVLERLPLNSSFPLRTFNAKSGAGFHDDGIGPVPFSISLEPMDYVEVDQVSPFVERLPQTGIPGEDAPAWSPSGVILRQTTDVRKFEIKIPSNSKLEYQVLGDGTAEISPNGIVLRRTGPGTIVWQRFRIIPVQFLSQEPVAR